MQIKIQQIIKPKDPTFQNLHENELKQIDKLHTNGNLCQVLLVQYCNKQYALKVIDKNKINAEQYVFEYRRIYTEISVLYHLKNQHIIKLLWHKETKDSIYLLFENFGIKLKKFLKKNKLNDEDSKSVIKKICQGILYIHNANIIHRDLTLDNILIDNNLNIKLIDFGFANQLLNGVRKTSLGSFQYVAPQIINKEPHNKKSDIWSLGIIIFQLFHDRNPFCSTRKFNPQQFEKNRNSITFTISTAIPYRVQHLLKNILVRNPQNRPTIQQILQDEWFADENEDQFDIFIKRQESDRKTSKVPHNNTTTHIYNSNKDLKQMTIRQLELMLSNLVTSHSKQLIRKKQLLSQLLRTQQKIFEMNQARTQKILK